MAHPSFQLKKAKNDQYYFTLTAKNGQVIAQSEMYNSKDAAELKGLRQVNPLRLIKEILRRAPFSLRACAYDVLRGRLFYSAFVFLRILLATVPTT